MRIYANSITTYEETPQMSAQSYRYGFWILVLMSSFHSLFLQVDANNINDLKARVCLLESTSC